MDASVEVRLGPLPAPTKKSGIGRRGATTTDMAVTSSQTRALTPCGARNGTRVSFRATLTFAIGVLVLLGGVILSLIVGAWPALARVRLRLPDPRSLEPGDREVRRAGADLRHHRHLGDRHGVRRARQFRHRPVHHRIVPDLAEAAARHRHRTARRHPQHHLRHLGPVRVRAVPAADRPALAHRARSASCRGSARSSAARPTASAC